MARHYLAAGHQVVAVGSSLERAAALSEAARALGAAGRLHFYQADLSSVAATAEIGDLIRVRHPVVDALVLGAFRYQPQRRETAEGLEQTFALYVVSRHLLVEKLLPALDQASRPVIVNLCGTGGIRAGSVHWEDLQLRHGYRAFAAAMQGARAADLMGVAFAANHPDSAARYVLYNPLFVDTGLAEPFRQPVRAVVKVLSQLFAIKVDKAIGPIVSLVDSPPTEPLTAYRNGKPVAATGPAFDPADAARLTARLRDIVAKALKADGLAV